MAERFMAVANKKSASPTWIDVRAAIFTFDRVGLRGWSEIASAPVHWAAGSDADTNFGVT
jgi:hypothetical protein